MSYKTNYLKSCFITLILSLLYIVLIKTILTQEVFGNTEGFKYGEVLLSISAFFIVITGIISPLSFFLSGKYTTRIKEPARPDLLTPNKVYDEKVISQTEQGNAKDKDVKLSEQAKNAISCNPVKASHPNTKSTRNNIEAKATASEISATLTTADKNRDGKKNQLNPDDFITLYISNIPYKVNDNGLRELLRPFGGNIYSVHLTRDPVTKKRKGIAFIRMSKPEGIKAIEALNGTEFQGREIVVKIANDHGKKPEEITR